MCSDIVYRCFEKGNTVEYSSIVMWGLCASDTEDTAINSFFKYRLKDHREKEWEWGKQTFLCILQTSLGEGKERGMKGGKERGIWEKLIVHSTGFDRKALNYFLGEKLDLPKTCHENVSLFHWDLRTPLLLELLNSACDVIQRVWKLFLRIRNLSCLA